MNLNLVFSFRCRHNPTPTFRAGHPQIVRPITTSERAKTTRKITNGSKRVHCLIGVRVAMVRRQLLCVRHRRSLIPPVPLGAPSLAPTRLVTPKLSLLWSRRRGSMRGGSSSKQHVWVGSRQSTAVHVDISRHHASTVGTAHNRPRCF